MSVPGSGFTRIEVSTPTTRALGEGKTHVSHVNMEESQPWEALADLRECPWWVAAETATTIATVPGCYAQTE